MPVKITKEDEDLLERYSQAASKNSGKLIYVNALLISLIPIWLFWHVHKMPFLVNSVLYVIVSLISTYLVSMAYKNSKGSLMERVAVRRADAISKEVNLQTAKDKSISRKEREDVVREKTKEVAEYESTTYSIFYNNCLFLVILLLLSALMHHFSGPVNYFVSMMIASGATAFLSSGKGSFKFT